MRDKLFKINDSITMKDYFISYIRVISFLALLCIGLELSTSLTLTVIIEILALIVGIMYLLSISFSILSGILLKVLTRNAYKNCCYLSIIILDNFLGLPYITQKLRKSYFNVS